MAKKGTFCFYVTHNFLNIAPNALVLEDDKVLKKLFAEHKLTATIKRRKRTLRENVFIFGKKT